jgi:hypothetical protein
MEEALSNAHATFTKDPTDMSAMMVIGLTESKYSMGFRADNPPEHAKYLGYLNARELYPDTEVTRLATVMTDMVKGKIRAVYS